MVGVVSGHQKKSKPHKMGELSIDKIKKGLEVFANQKDSKLHAHLNACVHCGLCAESCIYYNAMPDEKYVPAKKVDLIASVYRRYCTLAGKAFPSLVGARKLDEATVREMVDLLYGACTMCGRCNTHCSIGIDISFVVRTGRKLLTNMGYAPDALQSTINSALETGNNMGISETDFIETLEWLQEDLQMEVSNDDAKIPLNETGKEILYTLNPREPKFFPLSISAMAKIFYAANESWTLSTKMYDVTNYAYYTNNPDESQIIVNRLFDEMQNLEAKKCVLAECGHGSRAFRWEGPNVIGKSYPFEVLTSVELIAGYIRDGRIKLDPEKIKDLVTIHDPCNLVRSGGIVEEQRYIIKNAVTNFTEMTPHGIENFCCGGGGGQLAMSEYNERRIKIARLKAEQIQKTGAKIVATPCHNCVDQLTQINSTYKLGIQIKTIAEIVADALIID
jgi:Fe-S oxidoreductase